LKIKISIYFDILDVFLQNKKAQLVFNIKIPNFPVSTLTLASLDDKNLKMRVYRMLETIICPKETSLNRKKDRKILLN